MKKVPVLVNNPGKEASPDVQYGSPFDTAETDRVLVREMERISLQCWHLFEAGGYIRVDFRTDAKAPRVIAVNANPCISPDARFPAACRPAQITGK